MPVDRLQPAIEDDQGERDTGEHFHRGEVGGVEPDGDHVGLAVLLVELREVRLVQRFSAEAAHHADPGERLLQVGGDRADRLPRAPEGVRGGQAEPDAQPAATKGTMQRVSSARRTSR